MRLIVLIILGFIMMSSCHDSEPAYYILPEKYQGPFAVVYNNPNGSEELKENGIKKFIIPSNGILVTNGKFSEGWRKDYFVIRTANGYDTLKLFLPNKDTTGKKFDESYYKNYTNDDNEIAVNYRQIRRPTFNVFNQKGEKTGSCSFEYEVITIGKARDLNDSIGELFISNLNSYLQNRYCK